MHRLFPAGRGRRREIGVGKAADRDAASRRAAIAFPEDTAAAVGAECSGGPDPREDRLSAERVERRLAAILAADVAGYSRLMERDEAGTLARLRTLRRDLIDPKIAEHKGRIVKTTGDGILIEFPSVVEAVACAVALQGEMAARNDATAEFERIQFRVGINSGDVIVEDGDIHGDGVNIAARLEGIAEPGGICVSGIVHDQVRGRLDCAFVYIGEQRLKNLARPVRVYRVGPKSPLPGPAVLAEERKVAAPGPAPPLPHN